MRTSPGSPFNAHTPECGECGVRWDFSGCADTDALARAEVVYAHLVAAHGYVREGNAVFKRHYCHCCGAPALYAGGAKHYCSAHREEARAAARTESRLDRMRSTSFLTPEQRDLDNRRIAKERVRGAARRGMAAVRRGRRAV